MYRDVRIKEEIEKRVLQQPVPDRFLSRESSHIETVNTCKVERDITSFELNDSEGLLDKSRPAFQTQILHANTNSTCKEKALVVDNKVKIFKVVTTLL